MSDKIVVIISSAEAEKACTGAMYAVNALNNCWVEDVRLIFFGPSEKLLLKNPELQRLLSEFLAMEKTVVACEFIATRDKTGEQIAALGVQVEPVGKMISDLIKAGYTPLVW